MRKLFISVCTAFLCTSISAQNRSQVVKAQMDTLAVGIGNARALAVDKDVVWFGSTQSTYGYFDLKERLLVKKTYPTKDLDFRSIALTPDAVFLLNTASPAYIIEVNKVGEVKNIVYQESHKNAFYDSMRFWDAQNGIAIGDPTSTCLSIVLTNDGGKNWTKVPCENLPDVAMGEAAFAASNTNIAIQENNIWIVTGGKHARILKSEDYGQQWELLPTPIDADSPSAGIFSVDFYDENRGIIVGGNFERPNSKSNNKAVTRDGGLTWEVVANKKAFGYASCVRYLPHSNAQEIITVGASGLYYSADGGASWKQLLNDYELVSFVVLDEHTLVASGANRLVRIKLLR